MPCEILSTGQQDTPDHVMESTWNDIGQVRPTQDSHRHQKSESGLSDNLQELTQLRRSTRQRRRPQWYGDCVTDF